jgi:hypothetical protein
VLLELGAVVLLEVAQKRRPIQVKVQMLSEGVEMETQTIN